MAAEVKCALCSEKTTWKLADGLPWVLPALQHLLALQVSNDFAMSPLQQIHEIAA